MKIVVERGEGTDWFENFIEVPLGNGGRWRVKIRGGHLIVRTWIDGRDSPHRMAVFKPNEWRTWRLEE